MIEERLDGSAPGSSGFDSREKTEKRMSDKAKPMKAYHVYEKSEDPEDGMGIVFAHTATEARYLAWRGAVDRDVSILAEEYTDIRARRAPWADGYAEVGHIPLRAYLENGWVWMCRNCDRYVGLEDLGGVTEKDEPLCERHAMQEGKTLPDWALNRQKGRS